MSANRQICVAIRSFQVPHFEWYKIKNGMIKWYIPSLITQHKNIMLLAPRSFSHTSCWISQHDRQSQAVYAFRCSTDDTQSRFRRGYYPSPSGFQTCCRKRRQLPLFCILGEFRVSLWYFLFSLFLNYTINIANVKRSCNNWILCAIFCKRSCFSI